MINQGRFNVVGTQVSAVDYEFVIQQICNSAGKSPLKVGFLATHGISLAVTNLSYRNILNSFDLICADGMPVVWALSFLHKVRLPDRVCGPDLVNALLKKMETDSLSVFFYGSTETTLKQISEHMKSAFPGLRVAGSLPSKFRPVSKQERDAILHQIKNSNADIILVGLGCPLQENWVFENTSDLQIPCLAVGAVFSFLAGNLKRPPEFMRKNGLEWLYRWCQEPKRLFHRYFVLGGKFIFYVCLQKLRLKKFHNFPAYNSKSNDLGTGKYSA